jgi:hypothetical protein
MEPFVTDMPINVPTILQRKHQSCDSFDSSVYSSQASSCTSSSSKKVRFEPHAEWAYISDRPTYTSQSSSHASAQRRSPFWKPTGSRDRPNETDIKSQTDKKPNKLQRRRDSSTLPQPPRPRDSCSQLAEQYPGLPPGTSTVRQGSHFYIVKQPLRETPGRRLSKSSLRTVPTMQSPLFSETGTQSRKGAWDDLLT